MITFNTLDLTSPVQNSPLKEQLIWRNRQQTSRLVNYENRSVSSKEEHMYLLPADQHDVSKSSPFNVERNDKMSACFARLTEWLIFEKRKGPYRSAAPAPFYYSAPMLISLAQIDMIYALYGYNYWNNEINMLGRHVMPIMHEISRWP